MNALTETEVAKAAVVILGVRESIRQAGVPLLEEYDRHPSLRRLVRSGFEVVTF
jgi:hypothetical protein